MNQNQGNNLNEDVLQHSSGIRNQPGGAGPNANSTITLYAQK